MEDRKVVEELLERVLGIDTIVDMERMGGLTNRTYLKIGRAHV